MGRIMGMRMLGASLGVVMLAGCGGAGSRSEPLQGPTGLTVRWYDDVVTLVPMTDAVVLHWTLPRNAVDGFELFYKTGTAEFASFDPEALIPATCSTMLPRINGIHAPEASDLVFRMQARSGSRLSPFSNDSSVRVGLNPPVFAANVVSSGTVQVQWTNNSLLADALVLERGVLSDDGRTWSWTRQSDIAFGATSYRDIQPPPASGLMVYRATYSKGADTGVGASPFIVLPMPSGTMSTR
jgi:hypothetical protein